MATLTIRNLDEDIKARQGRGRAGGRISKTRKRRKKASSAVSFPSFRDPSPSLALAGPIALGHYCHCGYCRKLHGTAAGVFGSVRAQEFRWLRGQDARQSYCTAPPNNLRWHCSTCGSPTPGDARDERCGVTLGPLEGEGIEIRARAHIFVGSKAVWHTITDQLPCFEAWPPGYDFPVYATPPLAESGDGAVTGSRLCGDVGYAIMGGFDAMRHCHCSRCRRASGADQATNAFCALSGFRWTRGQAQVRTYKVPEARFFANAFCERCGAKMPRLSPERGLAVVPAGGLDADPGVRPTEHIFVGSKASWFTITDALPQYEVRP